VDERCGPMGHDFVIEEPKVQIDVWRRELHREVNDEQRLLESIGGWTGG
jgi:hypothetical protein